MSTHPNLLASALLGILILFSAFNLQSTRAAEVVAWGDNYYGQATAPAGLSNVVAVSGGRYHSLALTGSPGGLAAPQLVGPRIILGQFDPKLVVMGPSGEQPED